MNYMNRQSVAERLKIWGTGRSLEFKLLVTAKSAWLCRTLRPQDLQIVKQSKSRVASSKPLLKLDE